MVCRHNVDTVGEFGVRLMFPPDPSGIWLDRRLSGPHSPFLPPVVGTAANSPTVSNVYTNATRLSVSGGGDGLGEAAQGSIGFADGIADEGTRKVLSWRISNTMEADFCIEALEDALTQFGKPEIFNKTAA
jgi:hypothetical protein